MQAFFQGISFRLAKVGVILAFVLGVLMSSLQLYLDFDGQEQAMDELVQQLIEMATPPAVRAVHTLDNDLSAEVVHGLLTYDFVFEAVIVDEMGAVLARGDKPTQATSTRWLTQAITEDIRAYEADLRLPGYSDNVAGSIRVSVDVDKVLAAFFSRSGLVIASGILRNMLLVLLLFFAFHAMLTKPMIRLSREFKAIQPDKPGARRLIPPKGNAKDELSELVDSGNQLLDMVELSLSKRRAVELALRKSEEHVRQVIDSLPVLVGARNREGHSVFANSALAEFVGHPPEKLQRVHVSELLPLAEGDLQNLLRLDREILSGNADFKVLEQSCKDGEGRHHFLETHLMPLDFYDETVVLSVSLDITERKRAQLDMEHMAYHDALTNLPNRLHLVERLEHEVRRAQRHGYCGALLFIDLDQFKNINDSLGHPVGDEMLKQVAHRLQTVVREEDIVARLGGDEFVVALTVLDQDLSTAALRAGEVGEKIRQRISEPYQHESTQLRVTCSIGVVVYPDKNSSVHELLRYADTAMYQVKEKGRDSIEFFNEGMADKVSRQLVMEGELHRALENRQFELYFQPKIEISSGELVGAEALLRWRHPEKGLISPADFIPVLETSGLILVAGQWVVEEACRVLQGWGEQGLWRCGMRLSVNISPRQFRSKGFVGDVLSTLAEVSIPDESLDMEITEGIVIQNVDETISTMTTLSEKGISFSLDDFGTGYSSISYLKRLPVSTLKVDQSFVRDITEDRNDRVLVETIVTMGKLLGMSIVAEGVEKAPQLELLEQYGCHHYQGYLYSPPIAYGDFTRMLIEVGAGRAARRLT